MKINHLSSVYCRDENKGFNLIIADNILDLVSGEKSKWNFIGVKGNYLLWNEQEIQLERLINNCFNREYLVTKIKDNQSFSFYFVSIIIETVLARNEKEIKQILIWLVENATRAVVVLRCESDSLLTAIGAAAKILGLYTLFLEHILVVYKELAVIENLSTLVVGLPIKTESPVSKLVLKAKNLFV